ncbi:DUF6498-containing protein [Aestuariimicrobium sp. Y1814]|uniref:DUF6498-containing protein n=1 Tax=Aestuariimicrobium sp. Y1814 TaxID=3418742 RepID=UPI003DA6F1A3
MLLALGRFLGLQALAQLAGRLPLRFGWALSLLVMVVVNAGPVLTLLFGSWGVSDLVMFYAIENVLIIVTTVVRLLTYHSPSPITMFITKPPTWLTGSELFAFVFAMIAGIFTLVGTILAIVFAASVGLHGSAASWVLNLVLLLTGYVVALVVFWFAQGGRWSVTNAAYLAFPPVPRVLGLHLLVVFTFLQRFEVGQVPQIVWVIVVLKTVWDLGFMVVDLVLRLRAPAHTLGA